MALPDRKSGLPKITEADIAAVFGEDATAINMLDKWTQLRNDNPSLALEIRNRAYTEGKLSRDDNETSDQITDRLIRMGLYVVDIVGRAVERTEERQQITELHFSDGDDDVSQPL